MKSKKEIKNRIKELKDYRDKCKFRHSTRTKYNKLISELEWVLNEE